MTLGDLPIGSRLLVRSKKDWRTAVISRRVEDGITLSIASPTGFNYRSKKAADHRIEINGSLMLLYSEMPDHWKENFSSYDLRW